MTINSNSVAETQAAGHLLASKLRSGDIIALYGDLGAGKTAFVQGLAEGLAYKGRVTSPTFTIVNEYPCTPPIFHFDMYRLSDENDLFDIGWEDYMQRSGIIAVEWSENAENAFPNTAVRVRIKKTEDTGRRIVIVDPEGRL